MDLLGWATKLNAGKHHSARNDDVFIDRLNHKYTVTMILIFAGVVTTQQYFGSPITCWVSRTAVTFVSSEHYVRLVRYPLNSRAATRSTPMISAGL